MSAALKRVERMLQQKNLSGLCRMLRHPDPFVRRRAVQALGSIGSPEGVPCLAEALPEETDSWVKQFAVEALRKIGSAQAVSTLTRLAFSSDRRTAELAAFTLGEMPVRQAQAAVYLRDRVTRNAFDELDALGPDVGPIVEIVLESEMFQSWPSGKKKAVLDFAISRGIHPSDADRKALAQMGVFIGDIHTLNDIVGALKHRSPDVRAAAARQMANADQGWVRGPLYRQFTEEAKSDELAQPEIEMARALLTLNDERVIRYYTDRLNAEDDDEASRAAYALARAGVPKSILALFRFAAAPKNKRARQRRPLALSALEEAGPAAVEALHPLIEQASPEARRLFVSVVQWSGHPEVLTYLGELALDDHADVQRAALAALVALNTEEAATKLYILMDRAPPARVREALVRITHPAGPHYLRRIMPELTVAQGTVLDEDDSPLPGVSVQLITSEGETRGVRAYTGDDGDFAFSLPRFDPDETLKIKVVEAKPGGADAVFTAETRIRAGYVNLLEVRVDRFFDRLLVHTLLSDE